MQWLVFLMKRLDCFMDGHRYLIEMYKQSGEVKAYKCLHCNKVKRCKTTS